MDKIIRSIEKVQIALGILFLLIFFAATIVQIVTRYLGWSVIWTEELANYSFIWAIFMGAAVMVNRKEHFAFDMLKMKLSGRKKLVLNLFIDVLLLAFNVLITIYGFQILNHFWNYTWETLPFLNKGYVWLAVPVMSITMILYSLNHIAGSIKSLGISGGKELNS